MFFELLCLGLGVFKRNMDKAQEYNEGIKKLEAHNKLSVWGKARAENGHTVINGHEYFYLTNTDMAMSEEFWESDLPIKKFVIDYYKQHKTFPSCKIIDKQGVATLVWSYNAQDWHNEYKEEKLNKDFITSGLSAEDFIYSICDNPEIRKEFPYGCNLMVKGKRTYFDLWEFEIKKNKLNA